MELGMIICLAAVACVGLIEWTKNLVEKFFKVPGFVWSLAVFVGAMLCGFIAVYGAGITAKTPLMAVFIGLVVLALAQIGYDSIVKAIGKKAACVLENEKAD
jgi:hypothetical protein